MFNVKVFVKVEDTKIAKIENLKESEARVKLKFVFSDNPKNNSRLVQKIDESSIFMERLIADFVRYFSAVPKF